jgi:predicted enzyme related to lactoylglutathione lyase
MSISSRTSWSEIISILVTCPSAIVKSKTTPHADSPYYVGFSVDGAEIGLVPSGHDQGMTGPVPFYDVDDINATIAALQAAGWKLVQEPTDVGAGLLVAKVGDPDGNDIGLRQPPTTP